MKYLFPLHLFIIAVYFIAVCKRSFMIIKSLGVKYLIDKLLNIKLYVFYFLLLVKMTQHSVMSGEISLCRKDKVAVTIDFHNHVVKIN